MLASQVPRRSIDRAVTPLRLLRAPHGAGATAATSTGRAFAGHANLAGMCDLLVMTKDGCMGMAGPPLVEAALGLTLTPGEIGPAASAAVPRLKQMMEEELNDEIAAAAKRAIRHIQPSALAGQ